jgi:hypothetical protein
MATVSSIKDGDKLRVISDKQEDFNLRTCRLSLAALFNLKGGRISRAAELNARMAAHVLQSRQNSVD